MDRQQMRSELDQCPACGPFLKQVPFVRIGDTYAHHLAGHPHMEHDAAAEAEQNASEQEGAGALSRADFAPLAEDEARVQAALGFMKKGEEYD